MKGAHAKEVWVKVVGFTSHSWGQKVFKKPGDYFEGFVIVDEDFGGFSHLQWARIPGEIRQVRFPGLL